MDKMPTAPNKSVPPPIPVEALQKHLQKVSPAEAAKAAEAELGPLAGAQDTDFDKAFEAVSPEVKQKKDLDVMAAAENTRKAAADKANSDKKQAQIRAAILALGVDKGRGTTAKQRNADAKEAAKMKAESIQATADEIKAAQARNDKRIAQKERTAGYIADSKKLEEERRNSPPV